MPDWDFVADEFFENVCGSSNFCKRRGANKAVFWPPTDRAQIT